MNCNRLGAVRVATALLALIAWGVCTGQAIQIRDATGALVGLYGGPAGEDVAPGFNEVQGSAFRAISATGYAFSIGSGSGIVMRGFGAHPALGGGAAVPRIDNQLRYTTSNCTGPAYGMVVGSQNFATVTGGVVFRVNQTSLHYVPKAAVATVLSFQSAGFPIPGQCTTNAPQSELGLPAFPNDPLVTGVPEQPFVPPLTLGLADTPWLLFRDSFESKIS